MHVVMTFIVMSAVVMAIPAGSPAEDQASADAKALFERGRQSFHDQKYSEAADAFRAAYNLKKTWKLLFNIGQAEAAARRYGLALEAFERYLAEGGDNVPGDRQESVLGEVDKLRRMVGALEVRAPKGSVVVVDNVERGRIPLPGPLMVAAGVEHRVVLKHMNEVLLDKIIRVSGGKSLVVEAEEATVKPAPAATEVESPIEEEAQEPTEETAEPEEEAQEPTEETAEPEESRVKLSPFFWVGAAGTVAAGIVSGVLWGLTSSSSDDYDKYKGQYAELEISSADFKAEEDDLYGKMSDARQDGEKYNKAAIALTAIAGVLLGGTIAILAVDLSGEDDEESDESVAVTAGPGGVMVRF